MSDIKMILEGHRTHLHGHPNGAHIVVDESVRDRLHALLFQPEFHAVGYSAFIDRACEVAETAIAESRQAASLRAYAAQEMRR